MSADFAWETGKQYRYSVWSRALVGVTEIDNKYTGLQLKYNVLVTPTGGNTVNVQVLILLVTFTDANIGFYAEFRILTIL